MRILLSINKQVHQPGLKQLTLNESWLAGYGGIAEHACGHSVLCFFLLYPSSWRGAGSLGARVALHPSLMVLTLRPRCPCPGQVVAVSVSSLSLVHTGFCAGPGSGCNGPRGWGNRGIAVRAVLMPS